MLGQVSDERSIWESMKKRAISLLLVLVMVLGLLPVGVLAAGGEVTVTYSYSQDSEYVVPPHELKVRPGLAAEYGIGEASTQATVLDAVVAAHAEYLGDFFTPENAGEFVNAGLTLIFGEGGWAGHIINGRYSMDAASQAVLSEGDTVDTFLYGTTYQDSYGAFYQDGAMVRELTVSAGETVSLELMGFNVMNAYMGEQWEPISGIQLGLFDAGFTPLDGAVTAEDGSVTVSLDQPGDYLLATQGGLASGDNLVPAWCFVTVEKALTQDEMEQYVADDLAALSVSYSGGDQIELPFRGESGKTSITWSSSDPDVISPAGRVVRQLTETQVTLTARITCGTASDEKAFPLTVPGLTSEEITDRLDQAADTLTSGTLSPVEYSGETDYGYSYEGSEELDKNILDKAQSLVDNAAPGVAVALGAGYSGTQAVSVSGDIYYCEEDTEVKLPLALSLGQQTRGIEVDITVPAHVTTKAEAMAEALGEIDETEMLRGQSADEIRENLYLYTTDSWSAIQLIWSSDNSAITIDTGTSSSDGQLHDIVRPAYGQADAQVTLTVTADYDDMYKSYGMCDAGPVPDEAERSRTFRFTVPAYTQEEWAALENRLDGALEQVTITAFDGGEAVDLSCVTENLMLPGSGLESEGVETVWSSSDPSVIAPPAYKTGLAKVKRPVGEDAVVTLTVTVSKGGCVRARDFTVTVPALDAEDLSAQVAQNIVDKLMEDGLSGDVTWSVADIGAYAALNQEFDGLTPERRQQYISAVIGQVKGQTGSPSELAKAVIALKAMGVDARKVYTADGTHLDLPALLWEMLEDETARANHTGAYSIYTLPFVLIALQQQEDYATQQQIQWMVQSMLEQKMGESSWGYDAVPPAVLAAAPYCKENSQLNGEISRLTAPEYVVQYQNEDGLANNANTTGLALMGLAAMGLDVGAYEKNGHDLLYGLLTQVNETQDGFLYNGSTNPSATEQGLRGLISVLGMGKNGGAYRLYDFSANGSEEGREQRSGALVRFKVIPDGAQVVLVQDGTEIEPVLPGQYDLSAGTYQYTVSKSGYLSKSGEIRITEDQASSFAAVDCTVSLLPVPPEREEITVTVRVMIHDRSECGGKYTYKNNSNAYEDLEGTPVMVTLPAGSSVFEALDAALNEAGISYTESSYGYIGEINGLGEFDHGPRSGWLYRVGSETPEIGCRDYYLDRSRTVTWFYTDDYPNEYGSEKWGGQLPVVVEDEEVAAVEELIASIGRVTIESQEKIEQARKAYDALTEEQQEMVGNYDVLLAAEKELERLKNVPFSDVAGHWALEAITFVYQHGLMSGTGEDRFSPEAPLDRAMLATILYRLAGSPAVTAPNPFVDVPDDAWYADAVIWASSRGIVTGVGDGRFAASQSITREQMAVMLYRYGEDQKMDMNKGNVLSGYTDRDEVSPWALAALEWANAEGLITGRTGETIVPGGTATRAEAAAILMGFAGLME